jgi:hypothetical protein
MFWTVILCEDNKYIVYKILTTKIDKKNETNTKSEYVNILP